MWNNFTKRTHFKNVKQGRRDLRACARAQRDPEHIINVANSPRMAPEKAAIPTKSQTNAAAVLVEGSDSLNNGTVPGARTSATTT